MCVCDASNKFSHDNESGAAVEWRDVCLSNEKEVDLIEKIVNIDIGK